LSVFIWYSNDVDIVAHELDKNSQWSTLYHYFKADIGNATSFITFIDDSGGVVILVHFLKRNLVPLARYVLFPVHRSVSFRLCFKTWLCR
jgi:hypothetical protein